MKKTHREELEDVAFNLENMNDNSFSKDKSVPPSFENYSNMNCLKDTREDFYNLSHTIFGSKNSDDNLNNTTRKPDDVKKR